jgi:uncharacterized repeat protein (TIGR03847 family)
VPENIDFEPVDDISVGTIGPAGQRQFFLRARSSDRSVVLGCEKVHVQGLVIRIQQILALQGKEPTATQAPPGPAEPAELDWTIGELGLGFHQAKDRFVIVAREAAGADPENKALATARFWVSEPQVHHFLAQASAVLAGGRPACPLCGLPIDPSGHPCPAANGSRPIF